MGETTGSRQSTHLVRQAARELASHNITVNAIAPGAFATNIGGGRLKLPEVNQGMSRRIPLGRVASPASGFITGAQIPIEVARRWD